ncbi:MAG TPA: hypothetical protein VF696_00600 [Candidatus Paceibacterota bacterium]
MTDTGPNFMEGDSGNDSSDAPTINPAVGASDFTPGEEVTQEGEEAAETGAADSTNTGHSL